MEERELEEFSTAALEALLALFHTARESPNDLLSCFKHLKRFFPSTYLNVLAQLAPEAKDCIEGDEQASLEITNNIVAVVRGFVPESAEASILRTPERSVCEEESANRSALIENNEGPQTLAELRIRCWKLFEKDSDPITFDKRITTIVGPIGSGKSSILEAIFATVAAFEDGDWNDELCVKPANRDLSFIRLNGLCGCNPWSRTLERQGNSSEGFKLCTTEGEAPKFLYVPQDHGLKALTRFQKFSWCLTFAKLKSGAYHQEVRSNLSCQKRIARLCGIEFSENSLFQLEGSQEPPFGAEFLSGGQVDAILCLLALFRAEKDPYVVLLDEPGQNLGAHERDLLRMEIWKCPAQVIVVTHHTELLDRKSLPEGLIRFVRPKYVTWRSKIAKRAHYVNGEALNARLENNPEHLKAFQAFIRSPANLQLFFTSSLLLVEGVTDSRAIAAIDAVWLNNADWKGLECLVLNTGGFSNCQSLWRIFRNLFDLLHIRVFALFDLDVLWKSKLREDTPEIIEAHEGKAGSKGGAVYYYVQCERNSGVWNELLEAVFQDRGLLSLTEEPVDQSKILSCLRILKERNVEESVAASFLLLFYQDFTLKFMPPEFIQSVVKALNFLLLNNARFPGLVWPPRVCDIEGLVFDKSWSNNFINVTIFPDFQLQNLEKLEVTEAVAEIQTRLSCDLYNFVSASLKYTDKKELQNELRKKMELNQQDESNISFSKRNCAGKRWFADLTAQNFPELADLISSTDFSLHREFCYGNETDLKRNAKAIREAYSIVLSAMINNAEKGLKAIALKSGKPPQKLEAKLRKLVQLREENDITDTEEEIDNSYKNDKDEAEKQFQTNFSSLKDIFESTDFGRLLNLLKSSTFIDALASKASEQKLASLRERAKSFDDAFLWLLTKVIKSKKSWKLCLVRDTEIHPICALMWRLKEL